MSDAHDAAISAMHEVARLEAENRELRADKERLDWLEESDFYCLECRHVIASFDIDRDALEVTITDYEDKQMARADGIRAAIDAARGAK